MVRFPATRGSLAAVALVALVGGGCESADAKLSLGAQCDLSSECGPPLVCRLERCRDECVTNRDCAIDSYCVFDADGLGACALPEETRCSLDSECPHPLACRLSRCANECLQDRDCPAGHRCTEQACVDESEEPCASNRDCTPPLVCAIDGRCRQECVTSRDCRGGTVCEAGACMRPSGPLDGGTDDGGVDAGVDGSAPTDAGGDGATPDGGVDGGADAGTADGASPPWIVLSLEPWHFGGTYRPFGAGSWYITPGVPAGTAGLPVSMVHLVNAHDRTVTVSGVDLAVSGDPAALAAVRLWQDVNVNGRVDAPDVPLGEVTTLTSSPVELRFSHGIAPLGEQFWLTEVDVAAAATEGTVSLQLASETAVSSDADRFQVVGITLPLPMGGATVTPRLSGSASLAVGAGNPPAATVAPGDERVPALHLESDNRTGWVLDPDLSARGNDLDVVGTTAMIAGPGGTVHRTEDGGDSWATQDVGATAELYDISMADAVTAWAVGALGNAYVTTDGGAGWTAVPDAAGNNLFGVHAATATEAWAVGSGGRVVHTTDGANWVAVSVGAGTTLLREVLFVDADSGWIVGEGGTILHTTNGGASWSPQASGVTTRLRDVSFSSATEGWVVGDSGTILHTTDGGGTWTPQTPCVTGSFSYQSVHVPDGVNGFALGGSGNQCVTADGGSTWTRLSSPTATVYGVRCISSDASTCLAATGSGPARTTTSGVGQSSFTVIRLRIGGTAPLSAIDALELWSSTAGGGIYGTTPFNEVRQPRSREVLMYWAPLEGRVSHVMATFDVAAGASAGTVILSIEEAADVAHLVDPLTASYPLGGSTQTIAP